MISFKSIIGQEQPISFLTILLKKGIMPNALLFIGPEGVGKRSTAFAFAMAANCTNPEKEERKNLPEFRDMNFGQEAFATEACGNCKSCRKFNSGSHPDLIHLKPQNQITKIAQIRELRQVLAMKPFEARLRVVIIGEAHTLNPEASNALLKVLEEPPPGTIFILATAHAYDLLPTILSRCQLIRFSPIPAKLLVEALIRDHEMVQKEAEVLAAMSGGSFSKVLTLKNGDWLLFRNWIVEEIKTLNADSASVVLALAENLTKSKGKDLVENVLEMIKTWFRDLVMVKYSPEKIINKDLAENIAILSEGYPIKLLMKQIAAVENAQKQINANANLRLLLENFFLTLAENRPKQLQVL